MIWRFGEFTLDSVRHKLLARNGSVIPIQPKAFRVLECLVRNAPEVVSREQLLTEVWGHSELCVSALSQAIREIRRALDDNASLPTIIGTRHGAGYFLLVEAQRVPDGRRWWKPVPWIIPPVPLRNMFIASAFLLAGLYGGTLWQQQNADQGMVDPEKFDHYDALGRDLPGSSEARALYRAGRSSLERLDWMPGIESLERARRADPDSPRILLELTRGYHLAGYQERAAELAQDIRMGQQSWSRPDQLEAEAILALVEGNSAALARTARSLSDFFRNDTGFLYLLFEAELNSGPPSKAEQTLDRIRSLLPDRAADARYWISLHKLKTRQGRIDEAMASADLALESSQDQELDRLHVRAMLAKIESLTRLGEIDAARQLISEAWPLADRLRDPAAHVGVITAAARLDILMGRFDGLEARVDEAFALSRQIGFRTGMARCNFLSGELYRAQGEYIPAIVHYGNSISSYSRNGQLFDAALGLVRRGMAELLAGRPDSAEHGILEAEELFRRLNDRRGHGL
ncbi:MAG: winged helix-turn-helix domain-containing protein, partial [Wenzhouxiangellaceae bacterium]